MLGNFKNIKSCGFFLSTEESYSFFFNDDLLGCYNYEKVYIDDSATDNTTWLMRIYV